MAPTTLPGLHTRRARRQGAAAASLLLAALGPLLAGPAAAAASPAAVVEEILDGNELYIERRQARRKEAAFLSEQVRTMKSRGQLDFASGAAGRLSRFSQLRLGSSCFLISSGQILVSGPQSACTRSSRLSTRGTTYVVTLLEAGASEVAVLEGGLEIRRLADGEPVAEAPLLVAGGNRVRFSSEGRVLELQPLTAEDYRLTLQGPLFRGFRAPLPGMAALTSFLQRRFPGVLTAVELPAAAAPMTAASPPAQAMAAPNGGDDPLVEVINRSRLQAGRPPFEPLPAALAAQNSTYLMPVLQGILDTAGCDHDRSRWDAFQSRMAATATLMPTSEVIACPMPAGAWNPEQIVSRWMASPLHTQILINRPRARYIDCVRLVRAGRAVGICTLWSPVAAGSR